MTSSVMGLSLLAGLLAFAGYIVPSDQILFVLVVLLTG